MKTLLLSFWLSMVSLAYSDQMDLIAPLIMARLNEVTSKLPVPKEVLNMAIYQMGSYFFLTDSKSELCRNHSNLLFNAFLENEIWALKMFDANSKIGSGLMEGNIQDLGSYDQCVGVEAPSGLFQGQHCVVETRGLLPDYLMDPMNFEIENKAMLRLDFSFGLCIPTSCSPKDVKDHFDAAWEPINASAILFNSSCSSAIVVPFEIEDLLTIWVIVSLCVLVLLSTLYDNFVVTEDQTQLLTSFSLCRNTRQLFTYETNPDSLPCIYGLRVIGLAWVVFGHRTAISMLVPKMSLKAISNNIDSLWWAPLHEGPLAVEIFFLMSGTLLSYNFMRVKLKGIRFNYFSFAYHRYMRLTPSLALMVLIYATLVLHLADGPLWPRLMTFNHESCQNKWWANLLYINNYYNKLENCIPQSWYLAADFQLYMLAPIILSVLLKNKILGFILIFFCIASTISSALVFASTNEIPATGFKNGKPFDPKLHLEISQSTHYKAASFLIGTSLGYLIYKIKQEAMIVKLNKFHGSRKKTRVLTFLPKEPNARPLEKVSLIIGWILSAVLILSPLYLVTLFLSSNYVYSPWIDPAYYVLHGPLASVGVSWIILVCTIGYGGYVNKFLSWKPLVPLARLSYGTYLVHFLMHQVLIFSTRTTIFCNAFTPWSYFPLDFLLSNILSAVLYMTVEAPCTNLFFQRQKSKQLDK